MAYHLLILLLVLRNMPIRMEISLSGDRELKEVMNKLIKLGRDFEPLLRRVVPILRRSVNKTFSEGGRPQKWPDRWKALETVFPNLKGKNALKVTGRLRQSVVQDPTVVITKDSLTYGTNLEYAKTQQFGGPSKIKVPEDKIRHMKNGTPYVIMRGSTGFFAKKLDADGSFTINVRPRPFLQIFDEDVQAITKVFQDAMIKAMKNQAA